MAPAALHGALVDAEARCSAADARLTGPRRRVLELLLGAGRPVKAYDLIAAFGENGAAAKPPTVYRALEFLEEQGFAHRIESLNAYVACAEGERSHTAAFLICDCCGAACEIDMAAIDGVRTAAETARFALSSLVLEAHGRCSACQDGKAA